MRKYVNYTHKILLTKVSQEHSEATIREEVDLFLDKIYFELEELIRYKGKLNSISKLEERLSYYTTDIPKRTVTNEQEPEAINDSIFY